MTGLVHPRSGKPISSAQFKKAAPPKTGEQFGVWAGDNVSIMTLPGGGAITFDLNRLTMADFRQMKDNYQINSSLSILTFMMHQTEWHIECDQKKIADRVEGQLQDVWSRLVRAMSQAFWAGYSPNVLQWDNDVNAQAVVLDKVKDLVPEDCKVKWKEVEGDLDPQTKTKPRFKVYDGIIQYGAPKPIPVDNSFWYPLLMENGDYYGKKLLRPAFQSWFFSILLHLFANRYYERYGEPTPVGRAPYEDEITAGGETMKGNQLMQLVLQQLRNRSTVVLPNDRTPFGQADTSPEFDYQIEYLESQMRGADFERYMTRLDEEMSLALFTPILMMRTAEVGSYNLGVGHTQVYLWMLNAITSDWAHYINKYILSPIVNWNFGVNAPRAKIKFSKMGKVSSELLRTVVSEMMKQGYARPSIQDLSEMTGMTFQEFEAVTKPDNTGQGTDTTGQPDDTADGIGALGGDSVRSTMKLITDRIAPQIRKAHKSGGLQGFKPEFGFKKRMEIAMKEAGVKDPVGQTDALYRRMDLLAENLGNSAADIPNADSYLRIFNNLVSAEVGLAA